MKWFCKYWVLKKKYDLLLKQYNELYELLDSELWKNEEVKYV